MSEQEEEKETSTNGQEEKVTSTSEVAEKPVE